MSAPLKVLLYADRLNTSYYTYARKYLSHFSVFIPNDRFKSLMDLTATCRRKGISHVITCDPAILALVLAVKGIKSTKPSPENWGGACLEVSGIQFVITRSFKQLATTKTGGFTFARHCYKNLAPYYKVPELVWETVDVTNEAQCEEAYEWIASSILVAVDIETVMKEVDPEVVRQLCEQYDVPFDGIGTYYKKKGAKAGNLVYAIPTITMCGYYGIRKVGDKLEGRAFVVPTKVMDGHHLMRRLNATETPKVTQNGGYEGTYFIRFNAPMTNWVGDTYHFMHSWFSELPRSLDYIASIFVPGYQYWKDMSGWDMEHYNAIDVYTTAWAFVIMVLDSPAWAKTNYHIEFRKCFPNICMGLEGLKVDLIERERLDEKLAGERDAALARLETICRKGFNPSSPVQVLEMMKALGRGQKIESSDDKSLSKWADIHPINSIIAELIGKYRECSKALSTYVRAPLYGDRLLYELNAGGTTTGRSSSKASNLWVGTQIQNQDAKLRTMYIADDGQLMCSVDGEQAESRTTAYLSQDETLMHSVETAKDFHSRNASLFFGVPEDEIVKLVWRTEVVDGVEVQVPVLDKNGKQLKDKSLRDLAKRVNHGANYNMAAYVLIQTMGLKNIFRAAKLLDLPSTWRASKVADHLLGLFTSTYPRVKGKYYDEIIQEIRTTGRLTLPNGWTRRCFGTPSRRREDKKHLNEYAAHPSQSLSVMLVDEAIFDFWLEWQIKRKLVRLKAQIHDEGIFQAKPEVMDAAKKAFSQLMARPLTVHGRTMIIPNDGGQCGERMSELK